jgi:hypothetical protein
MAKKTEAFTGANKYEKFTIKVISRADINEAYYNPRKIKPEARKALKEFLEDVDKGGLLEPLVWNEQTGNLLGGHQRLSILDQLHGGKPYNLTVSACNMNDTDEVTANIFLNNSSAQGEWDVQKLREIHIEFPELNFIDCGFTLDDIDILGFDDMISDGDFGLDDNEKFTRTTDEYREEKRKTREKKKSENEDGYGMPSRGDFSFMVIFDTADEKRSFLSSIDLPESAPRVHGRDLIDKMRSKV